METGTFAELREAGDRHYLAREYEDASRCFRRATDMVPTSVETWVKLGFASQAAGNIPDSIGAFKTAIGLNPQNHEAFLGVGMAYMANADFARAISSFDSALEMRPNDNRARDELVRALLQDGKIRVGANDHYGGEASLERAYKLARNSSDTVLPYVEHLIGSNQHKKAFDVIGASRKDSPDDVRIKALADRMDNDPKLAHAKQLAALRTQPKQPLQPAKPTVNPDEVLCPCGATRVMKWATVCPTCSNRIGDPANRASQFAGHENLSTTTWVDVVYYIVSVIWLLYGGGTFLLGMLGGSDIGNFAMGVGAFNAGIALGLLFQVEWVQFIAKILMGLNLVLNGFSFLLTFGLGFYLSAAFYGFMTVFAGFSVFVIHQMSD